MTAENGTTDASEPSRARRRPRLRWLVRLVVWPLLLTWFGWFAYVRWTTPPASLADSLPASEDFEQRVNELDRAVGTLSAYRPTAGAPWSPWEQTAALNVALRGEWDPAARPELADIAKHLTSPSVSPTLDRIVALCDEIRAMGPERPGLNQVTTNNLDPMGGRFTLHTAVAALKARARMRHTAQQDLPGGLHDLRAAVYLCALSLEVPSPYYYGTPGTVAAVSEVVYLAQEVDLPTPLAAELIHFLGNDLPLSLSELLAKRGLQSGELEALLDQYYTNDGNGNGWLVLSTVEFDFLGPPRPGPVRRSPFWNLFSPLFNDRKTVAAKLVGFGGQLSELDQLDYQAVVEVLQEQAGVRRRLNILDAPLARAAGAFDPDALTPLLDDVTWRRAAMVIVALSAYKHTHGEYPAELADLVPEYLAELPNDLVTNAPFDYERTGPASHELRSRLLIPADYAYYVPGVPGAHPVPAGTKKYSIKRAAADE